MVILLVPLVWQEASFATGLEEPTRWLGLGSKIILDPPEFFFEMETKRIAKDLRPEFKAKIPPGIGSERSYAKQTDEADAADFYDALKTGALKPPDPSDAVSVRFHGKGNFAAKSRADAVAEILESIRERRS